MNKGAILSLLVGGLVAGGYVEFQTHQSDGDAQAIIERMDVTSEIRAEPTDAVEPAVPVIEELPVVEELLPLPPPPAPEKRELQKEPTFTPFTVAPAITNREEVVEAMQEAYPPLLREAGIGGTIFIYFFIGADGEVEDVRINQSSGHDALDDAALRVADVYRFTPALNRDERVPVWVSFPITFQVR
jgi:protein TonB